MHKFDKLEATTTHIFLNIFLNMEKFTIFLVSFAVLRVSTGSILPPVKNLHLSNFSGTEEFWYGNYVVSWYINEDEEAIYFNVSVKTTGYVGFGISPNGEMHKADIYIAGVDPEGNSYSLDCHGIGSTRPVIDESSDWVLDSAEEIDQKTHLSFHRALNTCDDKDDIAITDTTMRTIWAVGINDDLGYHEIKGSQSINFYRRNMDHFRDEDFEKLDIIQEIDMPEDESTNWCTIHELPEFSEKRHIVAFEPVLESLDAGRHTYYLIIHRCVAPSGVDPETFFKPWTTHPGDHCHGGGRDESFPFETYCSGNVIYSWSRGGERMVFPDNIGLPISEDPNVREYYALEIHYDNGFGDVGKKFKTGGRIYYTDKLRENDAGLMLVQYINRVQLTIPLESNNFVVAGHCSGECTENVLPENGITAFNVLLGAHLYAKNIRLRHFRGDQELEWVDTENYFNFYFQQNKQLSKLKKIERGDQLTVECSYDTMRQFDSNAVVGGLGTDNEKCQAWIYYWPKVDISSCESAQDLDEHFRELGFTEWKEAENSKPGTIPDFEITAPEHLAGNYLESVSSRVNWTAEFRAEYQHKKRYGDQVAVCKARLEENLQMVSTVKYPENLQEYVPINDCQSATDPPLTTPQENESTTTTKADTTTSKERHETSTSRYEGSTYASTTTKNGDSTTSENTDSTTQSSGAAPTMTGILVFSSFLFGSLQFL